MYFFEFMNLQDFSTHILIYPDRVDAGICMDDDDDDSYDRLPPHLTSTSPTGGRF